MQSTGTLDPMRRALSRPLVRVALLAGAYYATARVGLSFADYHDNATLVWPPSGLSLAALILFGIRLWPGVFLGATAVNFLSTDLGAAASAAVGVGNALESVIGATLLLRVADFRPTLERVRDVIAFLAIGALGCTTVSAGIGVATLWLSGSLGAAEPSIVWLIWWLGDAGGVVILAPLLFMAANGTPPWRELLRSFEFWSALVLILVLTSWSMTGDVRETWGLVAMFTPFPLVVWAGTRLGSRGAVISSVAITMIATFATARGVAPFVVEGGVTSRMLLWTYAITLGATALTLAAATGQRILAESRYRAEVERRLRVESEQGILRERERIIREMHDGVGGQLVSTISLLEHGDRDMGSVLEGLRRALDDMRMMIDSLAPEDLGLAVSLAKLRARLEPLLRRNGITLRWNVEDDLRLEAFTPDQSLHLLRIIQEAVTNVLRHARATSIAVRVSADAPPGDGITLEIEDDGCGIPEEVDAGGIGIRNMRSRAASLGADLTFDSEAPGTRIRVLVPHPR